MSRVSKHANLLETLDTLMKYTMMFSLLLDDFSSIDLTLLGLHLPGVHDPGSEFFLTLDFFNDDMLDLYLILVAAHHEVSTRRYSVVRKNVPQSSKFKYNYFLSQIDNDFRAITRVSKPTFWFIHDLIKEDVIFHNNSTCPQALVHWQLACCLDRFGNDGQGISIVHSQVIWSLGHGIVIEYTKRVTTTICNIHRQHICWPDAQERAQISTRMTLKGFKGVVGFVDGTTFPLHAKPREHGNMYMDWKRRYSVNAQVVCDDWARIRHFMIGMPGSCHDSRVFLESSLVTDPDKAFSSEEYLLSNSGYAASAFLVPAYKEHIRDDHNDPDEPQKIEEFNTFLARARVVNKHCIGVLKAKWSSLRGLRLLLKNRTSIMHVMQHTTACVVLHNIALAIDPWEEDILEVEDSTYADCPPLPTEGRSLSIGQIKRLQVRRACKAFHSSN